MIKCDATGCSTRAQPSRLEFVTYLKTPCLLLALNLLHIDEGNQWKTAITFSVLLPRYLLKLEESRLTLVLAVLIPAFVDLAIALLRQECTRTCDYRPSFTADSACSYPHMLPT